MTGAMTDPTQRTLHHVDSLVRRGRLGSAIRAAEHLRDAPSHVDEQGRLWLPDNGIEQLVATLESDGLVAEGRLLGLAWNNPEIARAVTTADIVGLMAAATIALPLVVSAGVLAVLPFATVFIVVRWMVMTRIILHPPISHAADNPALRRSFILVESLGSGISRSSSRASTLLIVVGLATVGLVWLNSFTFPDQICLMSAGVLIGAIGIVLKRAEPRVETNTLVRPRVPPHPRHSIVDAPAIDRAMSIRRPRIVMPCFVTVLVVPLAILALTAGSIAGATFGVALLTVVVVTDMRAWTSTIHIGPEGITDRGVLRTRHVRWEDIHSAHTRDGATVIVDACGRERTLIRTAGTRERHLAVATINHHATGPDPGPKTVDPVIRYLLGSVSAFMTLCGIVLVLGMSLGNTKQTVASDTVPAGRPYFRMYDERTGGSGAPYVECPNLAQWLGGDHDPYCSQNTRGTATATLIAVAVTAVLSTTTVALIRSARGPARPRKRRRREAFHNTR